jgi:ubiquinone biosynthesis protein Coq4
MKLFSVLKKGRSKLLVYLTHRMALPVLRIIRKPEIFPYTRDELKQFPDETLGKNLVDFLDAKQLDLLSYYARHDIKHILLDYDTTDEGEGCLQCFMLGNGHVSFPVIATVLYAFVTMPEYWTSFKRAYGRGKECAPIANWKWFEILNEPTAKLKQKIKFNF